MKYQKIEIKSSKSCKIKPLEFMGSTLRGAYGVALKEVVCINPKGICEGCFAQNNCPYYEYYETKNTTPKFRFDYKLGQERYDFGIFVFGESDGKIPYLLSAVVRMLQESGVGRERSKIEIESILLNNEIVFENGEFCRIEQRPIIFINDKYCPNIRIEFQTPLRIKQDNRFLRDRLDFLGLLSSLQHREQEIEGREKTRLAFEPRYEIKNECVGFRDFTRYSNRQQTKMQFGGLVGFVDVDNIDERSFRLLKLGEIVGAGKSTVFGMGKIGVKNMEEG